MSTAMTGGDRLKSRGLLLTFSLLKYITADLVNGSVVNLLYSIVEVCELYNCGIDTITKKVKQTTLYTVITGTSELFFIS